MWILVDTEALTLTVYEGNKTKLLYRNVSIGRNGVTYNKWRGDGKTPLGRYRISHVNLKSRFHIFFGLEYPNHIDAKLAFYEQRISEQDYTAIRQALNVGRLPPQETSLGGYLGIHGTGSGDEDIHDSYNWTDGCVALTNEEIAELHKWIKVGMKVEIR